MNNLNWCTIFKQFILMEPETKSEEKSPFKEQSPPVPQNPPATQQPPRTEQPVVAPAPGQTSPTRQQHPPADIIKEVAMEERFPMRPVQLKAGVFIDYDPTSALAKLSSISTLKPDERFKDIQLRQTYIKHLAVILKEAGQRGISVLKGLFDFVVQHIITQMKDKEQLKSALLKQVPDLIKWMDTLQGSYDKIKEFIVPLLVSFLYQTQAQIKQQAGKHLAVVSHRLNDKDRGECVLKYVLQMAHDDSNEQNRIVAVQLFSKMADTFGKDLCEQFIGLELLSLGEDSHLKVRQQAIINLPSISKFVSLNFFKSRLLKFYQKKSGESTWGIRKSCVDIIVELANICDDVTRESQLSDIMLNFLQDANKWVKVAAYKNLAPFIATLKGRKINQRLKESYSKMSTHQINDLSMENQIFYCCAFNFPAVLDTLGVAQWQSRLYAVYQRLLKISDKKIKKTLASSLHQVAKIIGETNTRNYLFTILDGFLKDNNDEIKLGAIQHLSQIMKILDEHKRIQLIDIFLFLQKDQKKWRVRESIAQQLTTLSTIYDLGTVFTYIIPMAFKLCTDSVSIVRDEAASKIGEIVKLFSMNPEGQPFLPAILQNIKGFSNSTKFTQRQTFALMCQKLVEFSKLFEDHLLKHLQQLAEDKVINVRVSVARMVSNCVKGKGKLSVRVGTLSQHASIQAIAKILQKDPSDQIKEMFETS